MTEEHKRIVDLYDPVHRYLEFKVDDPAFFEWVKKTKEYTRDPFNPVRTAESMTPYAFESSEPEEYRNLVYSLIAYPGPTARLHRIKVIDNKIYIVVIDPVEVSYGTDESTCHMPAYLFRRSFYTVDVDTDEDCTWVRRDVSDLEMGAVNPLLFRASPEISNMVVPLIAEATQRVTEILKAEGNNGY